MTIMQTTTTPTLEETIASAQDDATLLNCLEDLHDAQLPREKKDELLTAITNRFEVLHPRGEFTAAPRW